MRFACLIKPIHSLPAFISDNASVVPPSIVLNARLKSVKTYPNPTIHTMLVDQKLVVLLAVEDTEDGEEKIKNVKVKRNASL